MSAPIPEPGTAPQGVLEPVAHSAEPMIEEPVLEEPPVDPPVEPEPVEP